MAQSTSIDYPSLTKTGFAASLVLLAIGFVGSWVTAGLVGVPAWETSLFFDAEVLGTLGLLVVPLVFGIVLPLIE